MGKHKKTKIILLALGLASFVSSYLVFNRSEPLVTRTAYHNDQTYNLSMRDLADPRVSGAIMAGNIDYSLKTRNDFGYNYNDIWYDRQTSVWKANKESDLYALEAIADSDPNKAIRKSADQMIEIIASQ